MVAVIAFHPGKTQMKITTVQIFVYNVQHIRSPIPIFLLVPVFPCTFQFFKMCFYTPVILVLAGASGCIHFSPGESSQHARSSLYGTNVRYKVTV
jgi:hypothetical protein